MGPVAVVTLPEEIDMGNAALAGAELRAAIADGATVVIADLTGTTFCDSSGVRMLVLAARRAAHHDIDLRLAVTSTAVLRVFTVTGLDQVAPVYPGVDAALAVGPRRLDRPPNGHRPAPSQPGHP